MLVLLRRRLAEYLRANIAAYFFITLIFVIGVVVGALAVKMLPPEAKSELLLYLKIFFKGISEQGEVRNETAPMLLTAVLTNAKIIAVMWFLGFTIIGAPFVLLMVWMRGFVIGFTVGFLVNEYIMKGLLFAVAAVLPHNLFAVPAILATAVAAVTFSLLLVRQKSRDGLLYNAVVYSLFCTAMLAVSLIAALVEIYLSPVFMKLVAGLFVIE
ncbi:MAG: stage II sporulation protein M [Sporomusaceae bacterium]|nr:stage II sporulation protein M [Sporomusaceae bacterium]